MAYINIEIDIDDLETSDLVKELCYRLHKTSGRKSVSEKERKELRETLSEINDIIGVSSDRIEIESLDDKLKYEHLTKIFNKYSLLEIQTKLPEDY